MRGSLHIIPTDKSRPHRLVMLERPVATADLHTIVGGYVEIVPNWETTVVDDDQPCIVFCNRHARFQALPRNGWTSIIWCTAMRRNGKPSKSAVFPSLLWEVAVITGDDEFMQAVRDAHFDCISVGVPEDQIEYYA